MKKLKLIYNPSSGDKSFINWLDECIKAFQEGGFETHIYRSMEVGDIDKHFDQLPKDYYDAFVICGGDGSVNIAVNAIMRNNLKAPLGIIPSGTANDFANYLKMPQQIDKAAEVIAKCKTAKIDLGLVNNEKYFVNVCAAGMFANISQNIDINFKNTFGKLAYYIKGVEQIPNFVPMNLKIINSKDTIQESIYFFFVLNSAGTGGFDKLSPGASINDGIFDFIAFKEFPIIDIPLLFVKVLSGEYLDDNRIIFFRDSNIKIECLEPPKNNFMLKTDMDGEAGPNLPIEIKNINNAFNIIIP